MLSLSAVNGVLKKRFLFFYNAVKTWYLPLSKFQVSGLNLDIFLIAYYENYNAYLI